MPRAAYTTALLRQIAWHGVAMVEDRKSTRLNSSHVKNSYAVFCLKKKTISRFGTASDFVARYALSRIGLVPGKDVAIVQVVGVPDLLVAVLAGKVQSAILNTPASFIGQKKGLNILADVSKLGLAFQYTGIATSRRFTREHPDIVRRYVSLFFKAMNTTEIYTLSLHDALPI